MRFIEKGPEPRPITEWKALASDDWQPEYASLGGELKQVMREALCAEQLGLCAYCQSRIRPSNAGPSPTRIEHFVPQSEPARGESLSLVWSNLLGVCEGLDARRSPVCERAKANHALHHHPAGSAVVEKAFEFRLDGSVRGASEEASADVQTLRLNAPWFRTRRKEAISGAIRAAVEDPERLGELVSSLTKPLDGELLEFVTAVDQVLRRELGSS